ncbi:MAG: ATP-binding protein [Methanobrevibacter smithii]|uniref:ATPase n=3 Tax=Methanobrevibacter smithii TaxID=2173 RepID=R7PYA2_METSM|nr:ATP-binding protein [Methanobrevibacter smithii]MBT9657516.1 AAA family ATPase [Methanobrevibacter smithii]MEE0719495.1 ATP-binding protein [Methanobrevibacter smithii]CDF29696.1 aTPase [Methanobrevibacter smithii CAG:186]HJJ02908.1 ATP-binding protein [Methanobrevibacter smithii]
MIKRKFYLEKIVKLIDTEDIKVITGVRRCGKTVLLKQIIDELENRGIASENIIYMSFESSKYKNIRNDNDLDEFIFSKTNNLNGKIYLLFDEIQKVKNWEVSLNSYRVDLECDIYITGSNSQLLSGELATLISGRYISINMLPFSFKELIQYYDEMHENIDEIKLFEQYLSYGGFPGLLNYENEEKEKYLYDLYSTIVLNDILYKNKVKDLDLLERLMEFMISNIGQLFSANSISKYIKNENRKTTPHTIINYMDYARNAFIFYQIKRENIKQKRKLLISDKYYLVDSGFYFIFNGSTQRNWGQLLENIVFLELIRQGYSITIGKIQDLEVDFVCRKANQIKYIQVSQSILDENTRKREFKSLEKISDSYPKYVISMDSFDFSANGIIHLNIIDFLKSENF